MAVYCSGHDTFVRLVGEHAAATQAHTEQIKEVYIMLRDIKEAVDRNEVRASQRDAALANLETTVKEIDKKIENGLRQKISETAEAIQRIQMCIERRKKERDAELYAGISGYFRRGFETFKERSAYIVVTTFMITGFLTLLWLLVRLGVHQIVPHTILSLFGIR